MGTEAENRSMQHVVARNAGMPECTVPILKNAVPADPAPISSSEASIQHPGESPSERSDPAAPARFSTWPDGPVAGRPRSATVGIRKRDGGIIGT